MYALQVPDLLLFAQFTLSPKYPQCILAFVGSNFTKFLGVCLLIYPFMHYKYPFAKNMPYADDTNLEILLVHKNKPM